MCAPLSANLRHVTIGTGRQHAGADSVRAAERDLLAKPDDLTLQDGHPGLDVVGGVRHGVILLHLIGRDALKWSGPPAGEPQVAPGVDQVTPGKRPKSLS